MLESGKLFHCCQLADEVAAVLVRREAVHRLVLKAGTLLELRAIVRVLRAVRAEHERQLALAAIHPVAVGLAAGVAVGGIALDGGDILPADALADAAMVGFVRRAGEVLDQHVAGPVALGDPLPVCLRPAHQLAAGGCLAAVHKERLVHLLEAPPYELHTPVHAVHAVGLAVLLPVAALLDRADLTDRHGEDVTCLRHWLCCSSRC